MNAYVDSTALARVILDEPGVIRAWAAISHPISSELITVECLRSVDRAPLRLPLDDAEVARRRAELLEVIEGFSLVRLDSRVLSGAADPFPTILGTLDAIHMGRATLAREVIADLRVATHDRELEAAARAVGFEILS